MKLTYDHDRWEANAGYGPLHISREEQAGYKPYELFVSAITGCLGEVLIQVCRKKQITYQELAILPRVTREGALNKITCIHFDFTFKGIEVSDEQLEKVIKLAMRNCSMMQSVIGSIKMIFSHERI
ncbi:hypothetical protein BACPU_27320 [Bacillus pumilus]|nr:hypothetical protein BACPU_27320 [Bacillus pumilus]